MRNPVGCDVINQLVGGCTHLSADASAFMRYIMGCTASRNGPHTSLKSMTVGKRCQTYS